MKQTLRPYQSQALAQVRANLRAGTMTQILLSPTGSGKTTIASHIAQGASAKGNRTFFVVDSLELVDQAAARFMTDGLDVGVIQGQHDLTDYSKPVQVATIQTLKNRWEYIAQWLKPDVVIIDEAHVLHSAHEQIIDECRQSGVPVIGLSATPFRKGLGKVFDSLVVGVTTRELTELGYLVPAKFYAPFVPDLQNVKTKSNGDWQEDSLAEYMGDAAIVGDVIDQWLRIASDRQTIVFAANVAHSRLLCDRFVSVGVKAAHVDGYEQDKGARTDKINAFRRGDIQVLCNVGVLTKGFDAPETSCLVIARPTKSLMLHIQMIGRGLRTADGKENCLVLDHAGNCLRNGLPTDELPSILDDGNHKENLDRKTKEKSEPIPKPCISCGYVSTKHKCPACGFAPESRQDVEVRDGELYEIETQEKKRWTQQAVAQIYAEFLGYAIGRYNPGWAWHKCREYTGTAPRSTKSISPVQPSEDTLRIIKHLNIKAAKRRAA